MSNCPKCGNKVDETMIFCPKCGASLKTEVAQPSPTPVRYASTRNEKQEKHQQKEKGEKHEKGQPGFTGLFIAGFALVLLGLVIYTENVYHWVPSGPEAGALGTLAVGVIIIVVGLYFWTRSKRRFPAPT
jgi:hypothetical protein